MSRQNLGKSGESPTTPASRPVNGATVSAQTVYQGRRNLTRSAGKEVEVTDNGQPLDYRYDLLSASPSGFEWGYGGSAPAQLAIAFLANALDEETACRYYQRLKKEVVAQLPEGGWRLTTGDIEAWCSEVRR